MFVNKDIVNSVLLHELSVLPQTITRDLIFLGFCSFYWHESLCFRIAHFCVCNSAHLSTCTLRVLCFVSLCRFPIKDLSAKLQIRQIIQISYLHPQNDIYSRTIFLHKQPTMFYFRYVSLLILFHSANSLHFYLPVIFSSFSLNILCVSSLCTSIP